MKQSQLEDNCTELHPSCADISAHSNKDRHFDKELQRFKHSDNCFVLVMGERRGAVGLDLSFVHHIILMEPIWDGSLEKQVVSRAHRMGCEDTVRVETLVNRNSIEHHLMRVDAAEKDSGQRSGVGNIKVQYEIAKRRKLLLGFNEINTTPNGNNNGNINKSDEMDIDIDAVTRSSYGEDAAVAHVHGPEIW